MEKVIITALIVLLIVTVSYSYHVISTIEKELQHVRKISWDRYVALTNATEEKNRAKREMLAMQQKLARYEERLNQNSNKKDNEKEIDN